MQIIFSPPWKLLVLLTIWIHCYTAKNAKEDMEGDGVVGVVLNLAEYIWMS